MLYVQKVMAAMLLPPGIFIILLAAFTCYMFYSKQRGRYFVAGLTAALYLCSIPLTAGLLLRPLEDIKSADVKNADVIMVLGGGAVARKTPLNQEGTLGGFSANRILTAAQLWQQLKVPVLITGGQVFADTGNEARISKAVLHSLGVPDEMIIVEDKARNTAENARYALALCRENGFQNICLLTSAFHMRRTMVNFARQDEECRFVLLPYPCDYQTGDASKTDIFSFIPQQGAMEWSYLALHEYLGIMAKKLF